MIKILLCMLVICFLGCDETPPTIEGGKYKMKKSYIFRDHNEYYWSVSDEYWRDHPAKPGDGIYVIGGTSK